MKRAGQLIPLGLFFALLGTQLSANDPFAEMDEAFQAKTSSPEQREQQLKAEFEAFKQQEQQAYQSYKEQLRAEFAAFKQITRKATDKYQAELRKIWDKPELSNATTWVEYSDSLEQRRKVDFRAQSIEVSQTTFGNQALNDEALKSSLKTMLSKNKAQAFKDDKIASEIERESRKKIALLATAEVKPEPILAPLVSGKATLSDEEADAIVERMLAQGKRQTRRNSKGETVHTFKAPLHDEQIAAPTNAKKPALANKPDTSSQPKKAKVMADLRQNKLPKQARGLQRDVEKFAAKAKMDTALVFAIIETESAFNPMARSPIPAYGLMQIVPSSAGQDATAQLFGKAKILSPSYLYNSSKNIEIGTTYLNILYYRYLKGISNKQSRLYSAIAAYNTGAGNVAKAFTGKRRLKGAIKKINALSPEQVYQHLLVNLPYDETRKYLAKVNRRISKYQ